MSYETETKLTLDGTETRTRLVTEWRPRGLAVEMEVRETYVWRGGKYQTPEVTTGGTPVKSASN
jgi:hypothetical protein